MLETVAQTGDDRGERSPRPVIDVLESLAAGESHQQILEDDPYL
jgi:uncharacterized protein (DUF433 family)